MCWRGDDPGSFGGAGLAGGWPDRHDGMDAPRKPGPGWLCFTVEREDHDGRASDRYRHCQTIFPGTRCQHIGHGHDPAEDFARRLSQAAWPGLSPCLVGLEAGSGAHHWAREIARLGHDVRLMPPQFVRPYVKTNKNDAADAEACCEAVQRPGMRFVPVKSRRTTGGDGIAPRARSSGSSAHGHYQCSPRAPGRIRDCCRGA